MYKAVNSKRGTCEKNQMQTENAWEVPFSKYYYVGQTWRQLCYQQKQCKFRGIAQQWTTTNFGKLHLTYVHTHIVTLVRSPVPWVTSFLADSQGTIPSDYSNSRCHLLRACLGLTKVVHLYTIAVTWASCSGVAHVWVNVCFGRWVVRGPGLLWRLRNVREQPLPTERQGICPIVSLSLTLPLKL